MNAQFLRALAGSALVTVALAVPVSALPPSSDPAAGDPAALLRTAEPVTSIPVADRVRDFQTLDAEHVMLSTSGDERYVLTLQPDCIGLRWARHVGVTASDNTIWAGFDALTADGQACSIRAIHLVAEPETEEL